jgi:hypothetical protein
MVSPAVSGVIRPKAAAASRRSGSVTLVLQGAAMKQNEQQVWVFGYGSLIWDTGTVERAEVREGVLKGWRREWNWISTSRHGAPTCSLEKGEEDHVKGIFIRLNQLTADRDLETLRARENRETEQTVQDVPEAGAVTHFWTMGNNLPDNLKNLDEDQRATELADRAVSIKNRGRDGISASDYIRRVNAFDPADPITGRLARRVFRHPLTWGDRLRYVYLLRVPFLTGGALAILPVVSLFLWRQLLGNLFVLGKWNIFWTTMAMVMLTWGILVMARVVLLNGQNRFGVRQGMTRDVVSGRALITVEALTLPMIVAVVFSNGQVGDMRTGALRLGAAAGGILVAHVLGYVALLAAVFVSPRYGTPADRRYPVPFDFMRSWLDWAYEFKWEWWERALGRLGRRLPSAFSAGYLDPYTGLLYPGHWLCLMMFGFTFLLYLFIGKFGREIDVPAIGYLLLLLILLSWILSALAFFLDRYKVPLLFVGVLFVLAGSLTPQSDHYYSVKSEAPPRPASPASILTAAPRLGPDAEHPRGRVVVVATAGGGIQAAAWTAQVLTGLQSELRQRFPNDPVSFADSIALISSVSGGAVGTLFFANQYAKPQGDAGFVASGDALQTIVETSEKPSLNDVGWALAYADFWRVFFPYIKSEQDKLIDRGWTLEEGWRKSGNIQASLSDWREGVNEGWRPALIFNSTIVETGEPLLLATTDIRPTAPTNGPDWRTLKDIFPNCPECDVPVATAVRLAASFPFVTPASRAIKEGRPFHVVDGGYYDNYGVYSLLEWLREALASTAANKRPDILIIQIRSFPSDPLALAKNQGWFYQMEAPLKGLMSVRTAGQLLRDRDALQHFADEMTLVPAGGSGLRNVQIRLATFEFAGSGAPLSWQMNSTQIEAIPKSWCDRVHGKNNEDWWEVLCFFHPSANGCTNRKAKKGAW